MKDIPKIQIDNLSAREKIIATALVLFNENGAHATGVDRIIEESKVAKMTFYKHFSSKEALIGVYYEISDIIRFQNLNAHTVDKFDDPRKQLLGIFDYLKDWFEQPDFKGCPFVRGLSDYANKNNKHNYAQIQLHFLKWNEFIKIKLLKIMKPAKVEVALTQILSLIMGSVSLAMAGSDSKITQFNKKLVEAILK